MRFHSRCTDLIFRHQEVSCILNLLVSRLGGAGDVSAAGAPQAPCSSTCRWNLHRYSKRSSALLTQGSSCGCSAHSGKPSGVPACRTPSVFESAVWQQGQRWQLQRQLDARRAPVNMPPTRLRAMKRRMSSWSLSSVAVLGDLRMSSSFCSCARLSSRSMYGPP